MKTNNDHQPEPAPQPNRARACVASCQRFLARIQSARAGIIAEFRDRLERHERLLELAVNEAEALAWQTGFPQLVFPSLALEKVQAATAWHDRQEFVRRHRSPLAVVV